MVRKETTKKERDFLSKTYKDDKGYLRFKNKDELVHRWVARNKIYNKHREKYPLPFEHYSVHHKDENKLNNRTENLQIVTRKEHRKIHGVKKSGLGVVNWIIIFTIVLLVLGGLIFIMNQPKDVGDIICTSDAYNCGNFTTCGEVLRVFSACGSDDIHWLDGDDDGVPCESLCDEEDRV